MSGLGSSAVWWPVRLLVCPPSVVLSHRVQAESAHSLSSATSLGDTASAPCCSQGFHVYLQSNFFRMSPVVILEHVCQKQSYMAVAKASHTTRAVAILRWPKVQPDDFQRGEPAAGTSQVTVHCTNIPIFGVSGHTPKSFDHNPSSCLCNRKALQLFRGD